jgi:hypothetical protein
LSSAYTPPELSHNVSQVITTAAGLFTLDEIASATFWEKPERCRTGHERNQQQNS